MARNFRPLSSFVEEYMFSIDENDYHKYLKKRQVILLAKQGIRSMASKLTGRLKSLKLEVNPVGYVDWPNDFLRYTKIGYLNSKNQIIMLTRKSEINYSSEFIYIGPPTNPIKLLDSDGVELLDRNWDKTIMNGTSDGSNIFFNINSGSNVYHQFGLPGNQNSKGYYRTDDYGIELSADYAGSSIILEYISDPSMASDPMIPFEAEDALRSWIYWQAIESKALVPETHKRSARANHYAHRRVGIRNLRKPTLDELLQSLRENSGKLTVKQ